MQKYLGKMFAERFVYQQDDKEQKFSTWYDKMFPTCKVIALDKQNNSNDRGWNQIYLVYDTVSH